MSSFGAEGSNHLTHGDAHRKCGPQWRAWSLEQTVCVPPDIDDILAIFKMQLTPFTPPPFELPRFMTVDSYMKEPVGALLQDKVKNLLTSIYQRSERKNDPARKARAQQLASRLVKVLDKKLKPKLTSVFKRFWTNANKQIYRELEAKGENPAKSKKKLAFLPWWFRDAFDKDGKRTDKPILTFDGYEF